MGIRLTASLLVCSALLASCSVQTQKRTLTTPTQLGSLDRGSRFLKAHMLDGRVYILSEWSVDSEDKSVSGSGELLDINRDLVKKSLFTIPLDSVALLETNVVHTSPAVGALALVTGASVALTVFCATHPKACFGSCPTFYVWDGERLLLQAEGFSTSITRALEARDIDALYRAQPTGRDIKLYMTNEALETHVIRYLYLLAAPRLEGGRVFATSEGSFLQTQGIIEPSYCKCPEGDCLPELRAFDGIERYSVTDSSDLAARETIEMGFAVVPDSNLGLIIASRQSLLSTFLFYQALAYMGRSAGHWLAQLERGDEAAHKASGGIGRVLGGIEVFVQGRESAWIPAGEINETGPLATDVRVVRLPYLNPGPVNIRLRLTRGYWRLDYIALARLGEQVQALRIEPSTVYYNRVLDNHAKMRLLDSSQVFTTLPGDTCTLVYRLPKDFEHYELFLESRGYYLEWMRKEWLMEENPARAAMIFLDPEGTLRAMAPEFKRIEAEIENVFWRSRYGHQ